jgi:AmmeMemoRadiSam system protein B
MLVLMSQVLPRLRVNLDFMPSPVEDRPGLLVRDGYHYTPTTLIIPPLLTACLDLFDGQHTLRDAKDRLYELTRNLEAGGLADQLLETLDRAGFLENETFYEIRDAVQKGFAETPVRYPAHAGTGYPGDAKQLKDVFGEYMSEDAGNGPVRRPEKLIGLAAPHVSPFGGWESYQAAYRLLTPEDRERVFVVLGTSHYGEPDRFGLTRKPYLTPYGATRTELGLIDRLEKDGGQAVSMEDYCHSFEHSIEFQVAFLQHVCGADIKVLPILCGSYARSIYQGGPPERNEDVERFLNALGDMATREGDRLLWILGIDMAHMGRRYDDEHPAIAGEGAMVEVEARDRKRIQAMNTGDAEGFWSQVQEHRGDDLKWCGSSPVYTFMKAVPEARGELLRYQQWNIDEQSVVSFAGMAFG